MLYFSLTALAIVLLSLQKYKYAFLLHLFIITKGFRFLITPQIEAFGIGFQHHDLSIIFLIFAYNELYLRHHLNRLKQQFKPSVLLKLFSIFIVLIFFESLIDYCFNGVAILDILTTNRKWVTLAVLPLYHYLKKEEILWIIKVIVVISFCQILIVPLQPILGFEIPGSLRPDGFGGYRYGLMPYFWFLAFWYIYCSPKLNTKERTVLLLIIIFVLIFAEARKNFLAILVSIAFFHSRNLSFKNIIVALMLILMLGTLFFKFSNIDRLYQFRADLGYILSTSLSTYINERGTADTGTSAFRFFLFLERLNYLKQHPQKLIFGYGFIHEKNLQKDPFYLKVGGKHSLDIGDISWAYILLRYGLLGIGIISFIVFISVRYFINRSSESFLYKVGLLYMVTITVLSFGDNFLALPMAFLLPYMISILPNPVLHNKPTSTILDTQTN